MTYELSFEDGIFKVKTHGIAEVNSFYNFISEILTHKEWQPGGLILVDHSDLSLEPFIS